MRCTVQVTAVVTALVIGSARTAEAQETHPFSVHDLVAMDRISDPQPSPDRRWIAFVISSLDLEANRRRTDIWVVRADGSGLRQVTTDPASDFNPRWSPDGEALWFLSTRSGSSQIWRTGLGGGSAEQVTDLPLDVGNLVVSPDGSRVGFSMNVFPECDEIACTASRLDEREARQATGQLYDGLFIRHWDTWKDGRRSHLFVLSASGGEPVDLMKGMHADAPSVPFGGPEEFAFAPDGRSLVFTAREAGHEEPWSTNFDLYEVPTDGSRAPRNLSADNRAWDTNPTFSPDGSTLAYLAMERPGYESDRRRIVLKAWPDGKPRVLTEDWDRSPHGLTWSPDGRSIYAVSGNLGQVSLFRVDVETGRARTVVQDGHVRSPSFVGDRIIFGLDNFRSPVELYSARPDGSDVRRITQVNQAKLARVRLGEYEQFTFSGWNGEAVYAYIVKPIDLNPSRKYPVAFLIHGGPQGSFGNDFHYRWNPQTYAGAGFAAIMVDFHGSTGYGQSFTDAIRRDWGGKPLEDLRKGLAAALDRYPWLDGDRVCALGASYGGYMINWIAGNWPDRFRCLVNHDGVFDMRSMYFSTEELWFPEWEHGGPYWENPAGHERHNPAAHVRKWKTPTLVIHGAHDHRVPLEQGLAAFTALQRQGVPSQFLYFPDENHFVLKPQNSIQWHKTVLDWLSRWLNDGARADPRTMP